MISGKGPGKGQLGKHDGEKISGIYVSYNTEIIVNHNFLSISNDKKDILNIWKQRGLSLADGIQFFFITGSSKGSVGFCNENVA